MFGKNKLKNILILGSDGMLGHDVYEFFKNQSIRECSDIGVVVGLDVKDGYDFSKSCALFDFFEQSKHFDYCINCIAYTNTTAAEGDGYDMSYKLNALVPKFLARACLRYGTKLIHISTDYVFSEKSVENSEKPYSELMFDTNDMPFPCSVYGQHKLFGEQFIKETFGFAPGMYSILRTSWLYGEHNEKSFIHKFIRNFVKTIKDGGTKVEVTSNEFSMPASTLTVLKYIYAIVSGRLTNAVLHAVPSAEVGVSRYEYAKFIVETFKTLTEDMEDELGDLFSAIDPETFVQPVERNGHWPHCSTLFAPREWAQAADIEYDWKGDVRFFIFQHGRQILENCMK